MNNTCHDFRRAFITRLYHKTKDITMCQNFAGHTSIETTRKYILDDKELQQRKFNEILNQSNNPTCLQ